MCGIAGLADFSGLSDAAPGIVRRMTAALSHRGPDADGFFDNKYVSLGHRRLSIIDISSGQQPMAYADSRLQIVFNGEIYNYRELRQDLCKSGFSFRTQSDTEVILAAYEKWGARFAEKLNGMFALAVWDERERQLVLARDRVGKKPLFYRIEGTSVTFASELKSLVVGDCVPGEIDREALDCYFTLGYIPAPKTIYAGVAKLEPATTLTISRGATTKRTYWSLECGERMQCSLGEAAEELEPILQDAVARRLMSEVPLGAFLSGGIDSSLVVSQMSRQLDKPVRTHTIGFDEGRFNETNEARLIARHLGTDHQEFVVQPRAAEVLPRIAYHFDEPFSDPSALPTWYVCKMTRQSVTVALSGDGGDEAFGGYTFRYTPHSMESALRSRMPVWLRYALFAPLGRAWPRTSRLPSWLRLKTVFENLSVGDAEAFYRDLSMSRSDDRSTLYRPEFVDSLKGFSVMEIVAKKYADNDASSPLARAQFADINLYMTDDVLAKVDRMSMAHSLEVRSPLLDVNVLEFAARLPDEIRLKRQSGKLVLREIVKGRLPSSIYNLPKKGFSVPAADWLRRDLKELAESLMFEENQTVSEYLDLAAVKTHWQEHLARQRDHSQFFWALMMLGLWDRECRSQVSTGSRSMDSDTAGANLSGHKND